MQDRVVELPRHRERPPRGAERQGAREVGRRRRRRSANRDARSARRAIQRDANVRVLDPIRAQLALDARQ
jgi:hypothetical protein